MDKRFAVVALGVLATLTGLWFVFKPQPQAIDPVVADGPEHIFLLDADHLAQVGPKVLQVPLGAVVNLQLHASADDELHVHGFDYELPLLANKPASLRFTADRAGRFELELHQSHVLLAVLEVNPPF